MSETEEGVHITTVYIFTAHITEFHISFHIAVYITTRTMFNYFTSTACDTCYSDSCSMRIELRSVYIGLVMNS